MSSARTLIEALLKKADVRIGGNLPWDIVVHDERLFERVIRYGTLGLGEAYMDGWWDASALDVFIHKALGAHLEKEFTLNLTSAKAILRSFLFNLQSNQRARRVGEVHYDLGNDLYQAMLGTRMVYTCGYWNPSTSSGQGAQTLDEAQEAKLDLVCRKIGLKSGDRVLDIGCGWGSFAKYAAENYGATVVGITISKEQAMLARELCNGLPIEIRVQDYREVNPSTLLGAGETFDHIVSLGMFEHVGVKNYRTYFEVAEKCLKENGLFLLHTIGYKESHIAAEPWIDKYIFPGCLLPSIAQIGKAIEGLFILEDLHNFGADYDKTLMAWFKNFDAAWPMLRAKYASPGEDAEHRGERFYRMWKYYLLACAGTFRARDMQLWQIVLSKKGVSGGYTSVR